MKLNTLLYTLTLIVGAFSTSSCSDWFDVSPKTDVKAKELFETESGFQSALAGIYISMTDDAAYGDNMGLGMMDQLAQLYDKLPDGTTDKTSIYTYDVETVGFNTKARIAEVWGKAYNLIANANNLIKWLDSNGQRVIRDTDTRNTLYGEAYAIRAFLHFDLLRGWGPVDYKNNKDMKCIPYRTVADNTKQPLLAAQAVVTSIINDLKRAETYLAFEKGVSLENNERRCRFNYYAVKALEARVYNYAGDAENAFDCANEVVRDCGLELKNSNVEDPVMYDETICGLNLYKMLENITSKFAEGPNFTTQYYTSLNTYKNLFEAQGTSSDVDIRAKSSNGMLIYTDIQRTISRKYIKNDDNIIPLIRLPEMYYIMCENATLSDAPQYINAVRSKRGYSNSAAYTQFSSDAARIDALSKEYRKEFYAEGQYFYFLKLHNITTLDYSDVELNQNRFVFPLPDAEKEYGWTDETTEGDTEGNAGEGDI